MARFRNKVVIVTGGARGQGAAEARLLIDEGASVVISDILDDEGRALAAELGSSARFLHHDVGSESDWAAAIALTQSMGGLHGLVNNAGVLFSGRLTETDTATWDRLVRINQTGCFLGMRFAAPVMERSGGGSIVNVSSIAGLRGSPRNFAYGATKWALRGMTKSAAVDLAAQKIRVNSVHPGPVDTEMLSFWTDERRAERLRAVPMSRMSSPVEIARVVLFLLSDESSYVTGAEVAVDGGATA